MILTPAPRRALVVDDERALADIVRGYLERDGFEVRTSSDGVEALQVARELDPDVVVLDVGLPGLDGIEVCRRLRTFSDCYVLMLTARTDEEATLAGLSAGADDYVTKPFRPRELVARVATMLRRPRARGRAEGEHVPMLRIGTLTIDRAGREVRLGDDAVPLTRTEHDLLVALAERPDEALSREHLIETVWGPGWVGDRHLVDVHVLHLRQKLGDTAERQQWIRTVRGVGYRMGEGT